MLVAICLYFVMRVSYRGGNGHGFGHGFGIKKRSWFGGRSRPAFIEPLPGVGVPPPRDANYVRLAGAAEGGDGGGSSGGGGGSSGLRMKRRSSPFPLKDDAGYIGYLTDDDESGGGGGGQEQSDSVMMSVVRRRRRELNGSDISFSDCLFMMITVVGLLMLFLFAVSPWGVPPPRRL